MSTTSLTDRISSEYNLRRESYIGHLLEVAAMMTEEARLLDGSHSHPQAPWQANVRLLVQTKTQLDALRAVIPPNQLKGA
jgi:hypothetical protein